MPRSIHDEEAPDMRKRIGIVVLLAVLAAAGGIGYYAYQQSVASRQPLSASGTVEADEVNVSAQTAARILAVGVSEGETIKKGRVIARLDNRLLVDQVRQAKAGISAASAAVRRTEDAGTRADVAAAAAQLRQAKLTYEMTLVQLGYALVRSPIPGTVLSVPATAGENATPGSTLAVVGDLATVQVRVFIPEAQLGLVKLGQRANAEVDSFPGETFAGKITQIASEAEFTPANVETKEQRVKQVFQVTVTLANPGMRLKPGMPADVTFPEAAG
ncbi:MAG: HlyD family efflux transporter periplasmic adaptor subunit [Actinobacteria bacterium]|nr:MAG: HlyD family efflux transporter periplasmic adaptor subunit [Actinomycetota bacterium]